MAKDPKLSKLSPFESLGIVFSDTTSPAQFVGDCPFCHKPDHFFVNSETQQWDCKVCTRAGNLVSFLTEIADKARKNISSAKWKELEVSRGLPDKAFKFYKIGWLDDRWIIPSFSEHHTCRNLGMWQGDGKHIYNIAECSLQLYGLYELSMAIKGSTVWICEGPWDMIALRWFLDNCGCQDEVVVACPGAGSFKDEWIKWFQDMNVIVCFDNDGAGDKGSAKVATKVAPVARNIQFLCWPESRPLGYDIRDFVKEGRGKKITFKEALNLFKLMVRPNHRRAELLPEINTAAASSGKSAGGQVAKFSEVLTVFNKWVKIDEDLHNALAISLAVCLSNDVPGDPIWFYIVSPPGGGKTLTLMSLKHSERTSFYSSLTPASLVSGFNVHPDPSLLPHLNGKTAVFKDGTELLAMHPDARREIYGILRGAFDGYVYKRFGSGVVREYDLHFNVLIGITPAIHADNQASMGERFLKYEMRTEVGQIEGKIRQALTNISQEIEMEKELGEICRRFLLQQVDPTKLPEIAPKYVDSIVALAQILSMLRAQVDREQFGDRDLKFRPSYEIGTRIAKQLTKLALMMTYVFGVKSVDDRVYKVIEKVAIDTAIGFHVDIMNKLLHYQLVGRSTAELGIDCHIPTPTMQRKLQDMEQLNIVYKVAGEMPIIIRNGPVPFRWRVRPEVVKLWIRAFGEIKDPYIPPKPVQPVSPPGRRFVLGKPKLSPAGNGKHA